MGRVIKVSDLMPGDVFIFSKRFINEYCVYIDKNVYMEWSNTAKKVWPWIYPLFSPDVILVGRIELKMFAP